MPPVHGSPCIPLDDFTAYQTSQLTTGISFPHSCLVVGLQLPQTSSREPRLYPNYFWNSAWGRTDSGHFLYLLHQYSLEFLTALFAFLKILQIICPITPIHSWVKLPLFVLYGFCLLIVLWWYRHHSQRQRLEENPLTIGEHPAHFKIKNPTIKKRQPKKTIHRGSTN